MSYSQIDLDACSDADLVKVIQDARAILDGRIQKRREADDKLLREVSATASNGVKPKPKTKPRKAAA